MPDEALTRSRLETEQAAARSRLHTTTTEFDDIVTAATDANGDDEHDPEGATVAFERARADALAADARTYLGQIDRALARLEAGTYGTCVSCGGWIGSDRLEALPATGCCIACAATGEARSRHAG